jgi:hypothetical protein
MEQQRVDDALSAEMSDRAEPDRQATAMHNARAKRLASY